MEKTGKGMKSMKKFILDGICAFLWGKFPIEIRLFGVYDKTLMGSGRQAWRYLSSVSFWAKRCCVKRSMIHQNIRMKKITPPDRNDVNLYTNFVIYFLKRVERQIES